ncbi:glycosyltransferase family 9 protein [Mitsuokella sp.]|uniref:glycosyltransferase family 9 protein n=1 Tax=uncultured Mitsuokella sp. TaxID=453120 RepID=UPI0025E1B728|nr:glycosyltransferase family 9 protein [uncultured Mitsuokella sp.]
MYQNILVINTMHIGDLMLVTPALRTLRTNYPEAHIALLTDKPLGDLVRCNKNIDECILIDKHGKDKGFLALLRFIRKIRSRHFDLVINFHRNERASAIAAFSGGKRIVGYSQPGFKRFFDKVMPNRAMADTPKELVEHQVTCHLEVLREAAGCTKIDDRGLEMWLPPEEEEKAANIWQQEFSPDAKVIAFNIGASWLTKRWLDTYFAECADRFIREGYDVAFFGGPTDVPIVEKCLAKMQEKDSPQVHVFTGKVSLIILAGLLRRCCLFLTTDSGPMHVGVAMNVPIVTMFGASPVPTFYPYDGKDVLIKTPEKCHPCGIHECPRTGKENMACMKNIPVDVVMKYAGELLTAYHAEPACKLPAHPGDYKCRVIAL